MNKKTDKQINFIVAKTANNIRRQGGLPALSLAFFEESEHPRNHGRFARKNGDGGESEDLGYDREAVRAQIKAKDSKERKQKLFKKLMTTAALTGLVGIGISGHPHLAVALAAGWSGYEVVKLAHKARNAAVHAALKYGAKKVLQPAKLPFVGKTVPQLLRGDEHKSFID